MRVYSAASATSGVCRAEQHGTYETSPTHIGPVPALRPLSFFRPARRATGCAPPSPRPRRPPRPPPPARENLARAAACRADADVAHHFCVGAGDGRAERRRGWVPALLRVIAIAQVRTARRRASALTQAAGDAGDDAPRGVVTPPSPRAGATLLTPPGEGSGRRRGCRRRPCACCRSRGCSRSRRTPREEHRPPERPAPALQRVLAARVAQPRMGRRTHIVV